MRREKGEKTSCHERGDSVARYHSGSHHAGGSSRGSEGRGVTGGRVTLRAQEEGEAEEYQELQERGDREDGVGSQGKSSKIENFWPALKTSIWYEGGESGDEERLTTEHGCFTIILSFQLEVFLPQ